jgi:outer membrane biosynthesis protein TonB
LQDNQKNKESVGFKRFASNTGEMPMPRTNFGSGGGDYFPDIKVGDRTYVNALANPQVSYYAELKKKFRLAWDPVPALRSQINQISRGQITVVMGLSVDGSGRIAALTILKGSGLSAYDAEARRTIMASAPFSKPPAYVIQKDGLAHMAWTFVVYL